MTFQASAAQYSTGTFQWVQLINHDITQNMGSGGPIPPSDAISSTPELDGGYPYGVLSNGQPLGNVTTTNVTNDTATDSPFIALAVAQGELSRSFNATMYLMWVPNAASGCSATANNPCTVPIPLGSVNWQWQGSATDTLRQAVDTHAVIYSVWILNGCSPQQSNGGFQQGGTLPQWRTTDNPI
jgi:hypothetical protein